MRRIAVVVLAVVVLAGVPVAALASGPPPATCGVSGRVLILSAFPAEMGTIMKATTLDSVEPVRSAAPQRKEFWTGVLEGKAVILALTGIGPVNATTTTQAAFDTFPARCIRSIVFSGVAGAGMDHGGAHDAARQSRIGDVTVPDRWTADGGKTWPAADPAMIAVARNTAATVTLTSTTPIGDPACACIGSGTASPVTFPYQPAVLFHGDGSTTDPFGGHAAPCLQHGGDLAGCEPCPAALGTSPDPQRFATGVGGLVDPGFFSGFIAQSSLGDHEYIESDEETGAAAAVAASNHVPFIGFRGISDGTADPLMLPGFPAQFFAYTQLAADNAAAVTLAFVNAWRG